MTAGLLQTLLSRGDRIAMEDGRLVISPRSGKAIPAQWLRDHQDALTRQIAKRLGIDAYRYNGYSTGRYGNHKTGGVTLQFSNIITEQNAYAVFNAALTRARSTTFGKEGAPLPKGHFRTGKKSALYRFWLSTQLPLPRRLSAFHESMGSLGELVFTLKITEGERAAKDSIEPLNISYTEVKTPTNKPNNVSTNSQQNFNKGSTRTLNKHSPQTHAHQGLQPVPTAGEIKYGNKVIR